MMIGRDAAQPPHPLPDLVEGHVRGRQARLTEDVEPALPVRRPIVEARAEQMGGDALAHQLQLVEADGGVEEMDCRQTAGHQIGKSGRIVRGLHDRDGDVRQGAREGDGRGQADNPGAGDADRADRAGFGAHEAILAVRKAR